MIKHANEAVDKVRKQEARGNALLRRTKYLRSPDRSYLAAPVISSASASSIAFNSCSTFSDTNRSSFVSSMFSSTCRI